MQFSLWVFTTPDSKTVQELLYPFHDGLKVAPYIVYTKEQAIKWVRDYINEYNKDIYQKYIRNKEDFDRFS